MKKIQLLFALLAVGTMLSCGEDEPKKTIEEGEKVAPALTAPSDGLSVVITEENLADDFTVSWSEADYGVEVAISYNVQIDLDGNEFAGAASLGTGTQTSLTVTNQSLNDLLVNDLGQAANGAVSIEVRVVASAGTGLEAQASEAVSLTVTPFEAPEEPTFANIWVAGGFQGWDMNNFVSLTSWTDNGVYEGYLYLPAGQLEFKLYQNQNDWGPDSWGTDNDGSGTIYVANEACCNFVATAAGMYWVEVDIPNLTYKLEPMNWGVVGDATPTDWASDTDMVYNAEIQAMEVTLDLTSTGAFKFRANDDWLQAFGVDGDGNLTYTDHLTNGHTDGISDLTVAEDGNYTITLDLHNSNEYTYSVVKN